MSRAIPPSSFARQPLDKLFTGPASVRVLRALATHGGALPVSRLSAASHLTPNGVRLALSDLDRAGAVKVLGSGRTKLFELNRDHPIGKALQALFTAERAWLEDTVTVLAGIAKEVAIAAWLFGSVAHCEDTVDSDLDLAVVMAQPQASFEAAADEVRDRFRVAGDKMGFTINTSPISLNDVRRLATARTALWNELVTNGRLIYGPRPEDLARRLNAGMVQERSDGQNRHIQGG